MTRLNLLRAGDRAVGGSPAGGVHAMPVAGCLIGVLVLTGAGWWHHSLSERSAALDADLARARGESVRAESAVGEIDVLQKERAALVEAVARLEGLRRKQAASAKLLHVLDGSLPAGVWLTTLERNGADVTIEGRASAYGAVAEFVANLDADALFRQPVVLAGSELRAASAPDAQAGLDLIQFTIDAHLRESRPDPRAEAASRAAEGGRKPHDSARARPGAGHVP